MRRVATGAKGIPYLVTHDGRTIRYPDPVISVHDTVVMEIKTGKIIDFIKFDTGNLAMVVGGRNMGRVGVVTHRERHAGMLNCFLALDSVVCPFNSNRALYIKGTLSRIISISLNSKKYIFVSQETYK